MTGESIEAQLAAVLNDPEAQAQIGAAVTVLIRRVPAGATIAFEATSAGPALVDPRSRPLAERRADYLVISRPAVFAEVPLRYQAPHAPK